jgi:hypothetical protein
LQNSSIKIIHINYSDNIKQPKDICKKIIEAAGLEFTTEYQNKLNEFLS